MTRSNCILLQQCATPLCACFPLRGQTWAVWLMYLLSYKPTSKTPEYSFNSSVLPFTNSAKNKWGRFWQSYVGQDGRKVFYLPEDGWRQCLIGKKQADNLQKELIWVLKITRWLAWNNERVWQQSSYHWRPKRNKTCQNSQRNRFLLLQAHLLLILSNMWLCSKHVNRLCAFLLLPQSRQTQERREVLRSGEKFSVTVGESF